MGKSTYDYIVVGGGSSGCIVAARLSEDPNTSVLLIEAGPDYPSAEKTPDDMANAFSVSIDRHDWHYTAEAYSGRVIDYARGKCIGGCSSINGTIALRGLPHDYADWEKEGNPEWSWDKILPYFKRIESDPIGGEYHGANGPIPIARVSREEAYPIQKAFVEASLANGFDWVEDHNHPTTSGVGPIPMNRRGGLRISSAIGYLTPEVRARKNLTIRDHMTVNRVLFEGKRAVGVEARSDGKLEQIMGGHITVSSGTVHNPGILWRSGVGPADALKKLGVPVVQDLPGVGQNLIEHCQALVAMLPREGVCDPNSPDVQMLVHYTAPGGPFNDMQIYCVNKLGHERFPTLKGSGTGLLYAAMICLNRPKSKGQMYLTSVDMDVQPRIELNLNSDPDDLRRMRAGVRKCWDIANTGSYRDLATGIAVLDQATIEDDARLSQYIHDNCATLWHPVGTCKLGPSSDRLAVVDQYLAVHGVENMTIADASVMVDHVSRNPMLTCFVIGERLADWLKNGVQKQAVSGRNS